MANVVIVAKENLLDSRVVDELNIITYEDFNDVVWSTVLDMIDTINIRNKLIERNYTWKHAAKTIKKILVKHTPTRKNKEKTVKSIIQFHKPRRNPVIIQSQISTDSIIVSSSK